jgi:hypothetical protein
VKGTKSFVWLFLLQREFEGKKINFLNYHFSQFSLFSCYADTTFNFKVKKGATTLGMMAISIMTLCIKVKINAALNIMTLA